jgi:hypothetical protein
MVVNDPDDHDRDDRASIDSSVRESGDGLGRFEDEAPGTPEIHRELARSIGVEGMKPARSGGKVSERWRSGQGRKSPSQHGPPPCAEASLPKVVACASAVEIAVPPGNVDRGSLTFV